MPTRNAETGEVIWGFSKTFAAERRATLPAWAEASRFNHFYRLAVNTQTLTAGRLSVGDELVLLDADDS